MRDDNSVFRACVIARVGQRERERGKSDYGRQWAEKRGKDVKGETDN